MMRYFHVADTDDLCRPGFTLLRTFDGGSWTPPIAETHDGEVFFTGPKRCGGRYRAVKLRLLIDVPTPFRRLFDMDYGRYKAMRGVNWWLRLEIGWVRGHLFTFRRGIRARET